MTTKYMDVVGSLRKLADELIDIGVEVNEPFELVAKIGGVSFMLNWIATGLEKELNMAAQRGKKVHLSHHPIDYDQCSCVDSLTHKRALKMNHCNCLTGCKSTDCDKL